MEKSTKKPFKRRIILIIITVFALLVALFSCLIFFLGKENIVPHVFLKSEILRVALITDIHASSIDDRSIGSEDLGNTVYPSKYPELFPKALEEIRNKGIDILIVLGDNTNDSSLKHAQNLKDMVENSGVETIWVKGNHDRKNDVMRKLGPEGSYYFAEKENWRIIVLDTNEEGNVSREGGMGGKQIEWLKGALQTDKKVLIAMHHPVWDKATITKIDPTYASFVEGIEKSDNVEYVVSGHWHTSYWEREKEGIRYFGMPAFLLRDMEGYYKTIDLITYKWKWEND